MSEPEFWRDDAAALANREAQRAIEARSGMRMPEASKPSASRRPAQPPSTFRPAQSQQPRPTMAAKPEKSAGWWVAVIAGGVVVGSVVCAAVGFAAGWFAFSVQDVVTRAEFEQLAVGMTMDEANAVIGTKGVEQLETNAFGERFKVLAWQNSNGTVVTASFDNGKLQSKFHVGL